MPSYNQEACATGLVGLLLAGLAVVPLENPKLESYQSITLTITFRPGSVDSCHLRIFIENTIIQKSSSTFGWRLRKMPNRE
jgi:hypothetical protein